MRKGKRGQNLSEYAIIIGLVSLALIGMQVYIKRGMQGRLRDLANQISPTQYERGNTTATYITTHNTDVSESQGHLDYTRTVSTDTTSRTGSETVTGN